MKKIIFVLACAGISVLSAQPVIQDGNGRVGIGFTSPISVSAPTTPGSAGANQTWDYSTLSFNTMGSMEVADVTGSPYAANYPSANYLWKLNVGGNILYNYQNFSAGMMEDITAAYGGPGVGTDYSPNPPTRLIFPMSFGSTVTDSWQKTGGSTNSVVVTYDAYGTFITPLNTYTNVVRVANDFGSNEVDYSWFITAPLRLLAVHKHSDNTIILIDGAGLNNETLPASSEFSIFPNPARENFEISYTGNGSGTLELYSILGSKVKTLKINSGNQKVNCAELTAGIYTYNFIAENGHFATGRINIL